MQIAGIDPCSDCHCACMNLISCQLPLFILITSLFGISAHHKAKFSSVLGYNQPGWSVATAEDPSEADKAS